MLTTKAQREVHFVEAARAADIAKFFGVTVSEIDNACTLVRVDGRNVQVTTEEDVANWLHQRFKSQLTYDECRKLIPALKSEFIASGEATPYREIKRFAFKSDPALTWCRLSFDPDSKAQPSPELRDVFSRANHPEHLALWLGSVLDAESDYSQVLFLSGDGADSKGSLCEMVADALPGGCGLLASHDFSNAHGLASIEGKRVLIFSDENDVRVLSSGPLKALTGNGQYRLNPKHEKHRTIETQFKIIMASNNKAQPQDRNCDRRRLVPILLRSFDRSQIDIGFKSRLRSAAVVNMQYCYEQYREWRASNPTALLPASFEEFPDEVSQLCDECFEFKPEASVTPAQVTAILNSKGKNQFVQGALNDLFVARGAIKDKKGGDGKARWHGVGIKAIRVVLE